MSEDRIDLGCGVWMYWLRWAPDRALNPQYADLPDCEHALAIVGHCHPDGTECEGAVPLDRPGYPEFGRGPGWMVVQEEPLTLSPSIQADCGLHGFIRDGRWVPA